MLPAWRARQAEIDTAPRVFGVASREQIAGKTGIELFQAMIRGELPAPPISKTLDFILVEAEVGRVVFQGRPGLAHYNPMGTVHGGWFATLLDSALGCSVASTLPAGKAYTTAELKINIVRPLTDKVPLVRAEAHVIHGGQRMATADARLTGPDGKLYAHGSTTCFIYDTP
ncbi:MAG: PaaI family thioesterase [Caldimonas sp.]